LPRIDILFN
jgi:hypothetical protein